MRVRWAWEQVRPRVAQLSLVIAVVAIGVGLSGGVLLANRTLQKSFVASANGLSGEAQIVLTSTTSHGALDERLPARVASVRGVDAAAPLLLGTGYLDDRTVLRIIGVDMLDEGTVRVHGGDGRLGLDDPLIFLNQPDSILVPRAALDRWGIERGESIEVELPIGRKALVAREVLEDRGVARAFAGNLAIMDLYAAQDVLGVRGIRRVDVRVEEGVAPGDVAERLRERLGDGIRVQLTAEATSAAVGTVRSFQLFFDVITLVGLLLGAVITANRLATVYEERALEIGILRSQGMSPREVLHRLLLEAACVTSLGAALGMLVSIGFSQIIAGPLTVGIAAASRQEILAPWVDVHPGPLLMASVAGVASGMIAAWRPARRASRREVVEALTDGRSRATGTEGRSRTLARPVVVGVACASLTALGVDPGNGWLGWIAVVSTGVGGVVLMRPALRLATSLVGAFFRGSATVALDDQAAAPGRAVGAVAVLMFGGAMVVLIGSMGRSIEDHILAETSPPRQGDLAVDANRGTLSKGEGERRISEEVVSRIRAVPGVKVAVGGAALSIEAPRTGIWAVDPDWLRHPALGDFQLVGDPSDEALERVARGEAILANFPPERPVRVGDVVTLPTPSGTLELPVAALSGAISIRPEGNVILSREVYRERWRDETIHHVHLLVDEGARIPEVARRILDELGEEYGLRVLTPGELAAWLRESIRQGLVIADVVAVLTLLVVVLGTADALAASVHERTREIGSLRALGCTPALARHMVLVQALGIGLAGGGLAVVVGIGWTVGYVAGVLPATVGLDVAVQVPPIILVVATGLGVAACLGGALIPSLRAGRIQVVEALRYE